MSKKMTPERWAKIEELYHAALELGGAERMAYLAEACAGDTGLREEVESLIASAEREESFMDSPLIKITNDSFGLEPQLAPGERLGSYQILGTLGEGGMGVVYLALDTKLNRKVALKLLPPSLRRDGERLRRLRKEAQAASALNHPNILTIYEVGEAEQGTYIASEYVNGETLRERMGAGLDLAHALDIATQIAAALEAAHSSGIIHRDIKPENVMLRQDGYVKVLDFSLAKVGEPQAAAVGTEAPKRSLVRTEPGVVMGTAKYMSPEQARGREVDARTDVFSLGVVLYEMAARRPPFNGDTPSDLLATILRDEPEPIAHFAPVAPEGLQRILDRSLHKDREWRYRDCGEMLLDLKSLKKGLEVEAKIEASSVQGNGRGAATGEVFLGRATPTGAATAVLTEEAVPVGPRSWVGSIFSRVGGHGPEWRGGAAALSAALFVALAGVAFGLYSYVMRREHPLPFQKARVSKLTNFGGALYPAISPDGKYVVYGKADGGKFSLWLRAVGTTSETQVVPPTGGMYLGATFSPGGKEITYGARLSNQPASVYTVPVLGGNARRLPLKGATQVSFSPDGNRLAYLYNNYPEGKTSLVVANADGTQEREVVTRQAPNYYWTAIIPSWSPDGRLVACVGQNAGESFPHLYAVDVETGTETPLTAQRWTTIRGVAWLPDLAGILIVASEETSTVRQIWRISYPGGEAHRITNDTANYQGLSLSADGRTLLTAQVEIPLSIWVTSVEPSKDPAKDIWPSVNAGTANRINSNMVNDHQTALAYGRVVWAPDGRLVHTSEESGNVDIWLIKADGGDRRQLTTDEHWDTAPDVSPDGNSIVFMSNRTGNESLWLMDIDGGNQRRLTNKLIERVPVFSGDGKWVFFCSWETGIQTVWKVPAEGGQPVQVVKGLSSSPAISPGGKLLAYTALGKVFIISAEDGSPVKTLEARGGAVQWMPDGRGLSYLSGRDGVSNLWVQPLDGGEPKQLTDFKSDGIWSYAWSRDGRQLAFTRGTQSSQAILLTDPR